MEGGAILVADDEGADGSLADADRCEDAEPPEP